MAPGQPCPAPHRTPVKGLIPALQPAVLNLASVPAFAPVAIQLLNIVSQENVGLNKLAGLIRADPGMSLEVLRLANSPLFGARSEITGILHALAMLGLNRIKAMVMTVAIRDFLSPARNAAVFAPCWRHCLATAFLAEEIAAYGSQDRDSCYTAGLIHEVGQLALIAARPADYDAMVRTCGQPDASLPEFERQWFGIDRYQLADRLADHWNLPPQFRCIVARREPQSGIDELVHTACEMAGMMGFRVGAADEDLDLTTLRALPPEMSERLPEVFDELVATIATKINTVECSLVMV
ncbi:MAG TPA: HDOD domain-containing protein [Bryobacteraceae bacterium]|nr:HDOD domain-containing protein [Bryobacteraceae bacterium]